MEQTPPERPGPLAGLRVLELGEMVAAPYCTKLLGDLGAEVVKVERPGPGDPARLRGPELDGAFDPERSGTFLYLNTSKRSIQLDLRGTAPVGQEVIERTWSNDVMPRNILSR